MRDIKGTYLCKKHEPYSFTTSSNGIYVHVHGSNGK